MRLLITGKMTLAVQICLKGFSVLGNPIHIWESGLTCTKIIFCIFIFNLLLFSHNASAYKDQNKNWCVIGYVSCKTVFSQILGHFRPNSSLLVTMALNNKLRERNIDNYFR